MNSEYGDGLYAAPRYPQTLDLCSQRQNSTVIEDQKATARLPRGCAEDYDSAEREALSSSLAEPVAEQRVSRVDTDSLRRADQILVETERSVYVFTVKDPAALSGKLIGGLLGNRLVDAYLLPVCKVGERFTFIIDAAPGPQRLTTSVAKALVLRRKPGAAQSLNRRSRVTLEQVSD
ncbi:MAG TPA: hypothetical protein VKA70_05185 [Blastocatellia bacterium]|nr:hypothetical protein [Blastocatellia bacterium]